LKTADIFIIGSGSLAAGVVNALSQISPGPLRIAIIGRSMPKVGRLASIANARAAALRASATFVPLEVAPFKASSFFRAIRSFKPKVIFQVASIQSPWESTREQNRWTNLLASAGFGITLPLQLVLAAEVARAASDSEAAIINASYPDCVNVVLHRLGLRTTCGIGNCAIVEAFCRSHRQLGNSDVRVVGHHGHFYGWLHGKRSQTQPRTWVRGQEIESIGFHPHLGPIADELNNVTAATAVPVILSLLTGATLHASIPGVGALPGGYPFALKRGRFTLRLPPGVTLTEAIAHNKTGERMDGLVLESGVKFIGKARRALASAGFEYAEGFDLSDWQKASRKMTLLRSCLRHLPIDR
jgi:hypothetical protein